MPIETFKGSSRINGWKWKDDVEIGINKPWLIGRINIHIAIPWSTGEIQHIQATKFSIERWLKIKFTKGDCDPEFINFHIKT